MTDADISEHVLEKHTTWFNCGTCGFKTREKPEIESHLDQHNQDKYKCEECNVQLNNETNLIDHRLENTTPQYSVRLKFTRILNIFQSKSMSNTSKKEEEK